MDDSIFAAATMPNTVATLQSKGGGGGGGGHGKKNQADDSSGVPPWMGSGSDIWGTLQSEYGKVDQAFDTSGFDKAAEAEYGNITTMSDQAANAAAADYTNRARQSGGSAEGAGLVKAQGLVMGRQAVADFRMKQLQYDIQQKEGARQLAAQIASQMGNLRSDYLKNLTTWNLGVMSNKTQVQVANIGAASDSARTSEQAREFNLLHYALPGLGGGNAAGGGKPWWDTVRNPYYGLTVGA